MKKYSLFLCCFAVCLIFGCSSEKLEQGVVAKVNGKSIDLRRLEDKYDLLYLGWTGTETPTPARLKKDYGAVLGDLIVQELVMQALAERGLDVTDAEVDAVEADIRSDYTEDAFDQILVEEYIDLEAWRRELRAYVALSKFRTEVLRPEISLNATESEKYYKEHQGEFVTKAKLRFLLISGPQEEVVKEASGAYLEAQDVSVFDRFESVTFQELIMLEDRIPEDRRAILNKTPLGGASGVSEGEMGYECLVLLESIPEKAMELSEAYPLVEQALLDQKLQEAFSSWLDAKIEESEILVSEYLLPDETDKAQLEAEKEAMELVAEDAAPSESAFSNSTVGRLYINTVPANATIRILTIRPVFEQGMEVDEGVHVIAVEEGGYEKSEEKVEVLAGQDTIVDVELRKTGESGEAVDSGEGNQTGSDQVDTPDAAAGASTGRLFVNVTPEDAVVRILYISPKFEQGIVLEAGDYKIDVKKQGYQTVLQSVAISAGKDTRVEITLEKTGQ